MSPVPSLGRHSDLPPLPSVDDEADVGDFEPPNEKKGGRNDPGREA